MRAATEHGKFVAAVRELRANGFNVNGDNRAARVGISIGETASGRTYLDVKALTEYGNWANDILSTRPTSVQQALDFLVVAGILPAEHASWTKLPRTVINRRIARERWAAIPVADRAANTAKAREAAESRFGSDDERREFYADLVAKSAAVRRARKGGAS